MASAKGLFEEPLKIFTIAYNSLEQKPTDSGEKAARTLAAKGDGARNFAREKMFPKLRRLLEKARTHAKARV